MHVSLVQSDLPWRRRRRKKSDHNETLESNRTCPKPHVRNRFFFLNAQSTSSNRMPCYESDIFLLSTSPIGPALNHTFAFWLFIRHVRNRHLDSLQVQSDIFLLSTSPIGPALNHTFAFWLFNSPRSKSISWFVASPIGPALNHTLEIETRSNSTFRSLQVQSDLPWTTHTGNRNSFEIDIFVPIRPALNHTLEIDIFLKLVRKSILFLNACLVQNTSPIGPALNHGAWKEKKKEIRPNKSNKSLEQGLNLSGS